jgi:hypothetical protein
VFGALRDLELLSGICFWWRSPTFNAAILARRNPTCKPTDRMPGRDKPAIVSSQRVEHLARLRLRNREGRAFIAIDHRPFDLADRFARGVAVTEHPSAAPIG